MALPHSRGESCLEVAADREQLGNDLVDKLLERLGTYEGCQPLNGVSSAAILVNTSCERSAALVITG